MFGVVKFRIGRGMEMRQCDLDVVGDFWCVIGLLGAVLELEQVFLLLMMLELGLVDSVELESLEKLFICGAGCSDDVGGIDGVDNAQCMLWMKKEREFSNQLQRDRQTVFNFDEYTHYFAEISIVCLSGAFIPTNAIGKSAEIITDATIRPISVDAPEHIAHFLHTF